MATADRFKLGVVYRRPPQEQPAAAGAAVWGTNAGIWPPINAEHEPKFPGD